MRFEEFKAALDDLDWGKRLPTAIYVFRDAQGGLPPALADIVERTAEALNVSGDFNVLKFHTTTFKLSFLHYPDLDENPHPTLARTITVDLANGRARRQDLIQRANPPVLHRKDSLLPPGDTRLAAFEALTRQEEEAGLLDDMTAVGFRDNWNALLAEKGLGHDGHKLVRREAAPVPVAPVEPGPVPQAAAVVRSEFSRPVRTMLDIGLLGSGRTFFDYGCGMGDDIRGLRALGIEAAGWDPAHAPEAPLQPSDVVNLGFVLNGIENPAERIRALTAAWCLTRQVLVVTTLVRGREMNYDPADLGETTPGFRPAHLKFFDQIELQSLVEQALECEPVPMGLGMVAVFRNPSEREDFVFRRFCRPFDLEKAARRHGLAEATPARRGAKARQHELLEDFWGTLVELGRLPADDEYPRLEEVRKAFRSVPQAARLFTERYGEAILQEAQQRRKEDLLVWFALSSLDRLRTPFNRLSPRLQRDLKVFFGDPAQAAKDANLLLRGAGSPEDLERMVEHLGYGWIDHEEGHFTFHQSLINELPAVLRVFIGCGARLYGDPHDADLIKIHLRSQKLTLTRYDHFDGRAFPELTQRIKIDFRRFFVAVFEHPSDDRRRVLFFKERFMGPDHPQRPAMEEMSRRLRQLGASEANVGYGVVRGDWRKFLEAKGLDEDLLPVKPMAG